MSNPSPRASYRRRSLRFDATLTALSKAVVGLANFVAAVIVARAYGPAGRGAVAVGLTLVLLLIQIGSVGLTAANPYAVARDPERLQRVVGNTVVWCLATGLLLGGTLLATRIALPRAFSGSSVALVAVAAAVTPWALASILLQSVLLATGDSTTYNGAESATTVATLVALAIIEIVARPSPTAALAILLCQYPLAATWYYLRLTGSGGVAFDAGLGAETLRFGLRTYLATLVSFLVIRLDLILVNGLLGSADAGLYSVATTIAQGVSLIPIAIGTNLFPRVADSQDPHYSATIFRSVTVVYGTVCLIVAVLAWPVVHLLFGESFARALPMVLWLLPGTYALGMQVILSNHFSAIGYPRRAALLWAIALVFNVVINLLLLPKLGATFASVSSTATYVAVLLAHMRLFARLSPPSARLRPGRADASLLLAPARLLRLGQPR